MNTPARRGGGPLLPRWGPGRDGPWDRDPLAELWRLWRDTGGAPGRVTPARGHDPGPVGWGGPAWVPAVEEDETDEAFEIRAVLPGVPRERITVDIDERELRITGDLRDTGLRPPSHGGRFFHRTWLPVGADPEGAEASLTDGVLRIRVPKSPAPKRRRLPIGGTDRETDPVTREPADREAESVTRTDRETDPVTYVRTGPGTDPSAGRTGADT
ncbi:Hsp20/alpha crystallin family protein [Streptomyces glaucescens]|uniref:Hsp20/alpha crystallin family protein n=1 Tax=Streptomyces glaucescens TaxID=1907 RepID=UPI00344E0D09